MGAEVPVHVKFAAAKHTVQVDLDCTVEELKGKLQGVTGVPTPQQRLIFKGKILKDESTLKSYGISADVTLHLVRGNVTGGSGPDASGGFSSAASASAAQPSAAPTMPNTVPSAAATVPTAGAPPVAAPFGLLPGLAPPGANVMDPFGLGMAGFPGLGGLEGLGGLGSLGLGPGLDGAGAGGWGSAMEQMQAQLMSNPEMVRQMMNSPLVRNLMDNPEVLRSMVMSNPQMRELIERNPELGHALSDPQVLRQSMEAARNPGLMQEMMRTTDRAMSNIEAMPEGFNMLRRMYENVQEPFMDAALGMRPGNAAPGTGLTTQAGGGSGEAGADAGPNSAPLPNPWGPRTGSTPPPPPAGTAGNTVPPASAPSAVSPSTAPTVASAATPVANASSSLVQAIDLQIAQLQQMQGLMSSPLYQQMFQQVASNPELMRQMLTQNASPMVGALMDSNPEIRRMLDNPQAMAALVSPEQAQQRIQLQLSMLQLQRSMAALQTGSLAAAGAAAPAAGTAPAAGSVGTGGLPAGGTTAPGATAGGVPDLSAFFNLMGAMGGAGAANPTQPPGERYARQLAQLRDMGFFNEEQNIAALTATFGNVEAAIERLLNS